MKLIIIHKNREAPADSGNGLLRFAVSSEPAASIVFEGLRTDLCPGRRDAVVFALPKDWGIAKPAATRRIVSYETHIPILAVPRSERDSWLVISNGQFPTEINKELLDKILAEVVADVLAVTAEPQLLAYREKIQLTSQGAVAGFRRLYCDSVEPAPLPADWPHRVFVRPRALERLRTDGALPQSFTLFLEQCRSNDLTFRSIGVGGLVWDLNTQEGLLNFCMRKLSSSGLRRLNRILRRDGRSARILRSGRDQSSLLCGKVVLGKDINIHPRAVIVGPTIIGDNVVIREGAVIKSSIIGPNVSLPPNELVLERVVTEDNHNLRGQTQFTYKNLERPRDSHSIPGPQLNRRTAFRTWRRFSYVGCLKRIVDIMISVIVLILFAPVFPIIALVIKLSSEGPVFFRDKRQGLHGKTFSCFKFRSMLVGAASIQDKLRLLNQADGPQFKMDNDPRTNVVGRFLRDTYIDEIPQFINVVLGQMSVVGPRPSPESENTQCPFWRDSRLSVRPGITGLWQVRRTRRPMKDFQEWIYYDTQYVRNISLKLDLWICWRTAKRLVRNFARKF